MVVGAFPVAKLGALVLKQVSKPLANLVKSRAKQNPVFRNYVCMPPAQFYHWCEVKLKMWSMNLGKPVNIPKLNETMAIELGAELLGEGIIFVIAAGILVVEYVRSSRKEAAKEVERVAEMVQIQKDLKDLYMEKAKQDAQIREIVRILGGKIPDSNYNPEPYDTASIPEHHRNDHQPEEELGTFATIKGWVWKAIDVVLPEVVDNNAESKPNIIVIHHTPPRASDTSINTNPQTASVQCTHENNSTSNKAISSVVSHDKIRLER